MPDHTVSVTVKPTTSELYWANVSVITRQLRKLLWIWGIVAGLMVLLFLLAWLNPRPRTDWQEMLRTSKPLLWAFVIPLLMVFVAPFLSTRKFLSDPRNAGATEYHFSDSGVRIEHSTGNADLNWTAFVKAIETRDLFLLYVTQAWARVLPKRCLTGAGELDDLRQLIRTHVPKSKLRSS